jgi:queuine tRNA-ribosyltransferase
MSFNFKITHTSGSARRGEMQTAHGTVDTPAFMAVGTQGAVKAVTHRDLDALGAQIMLANTYHLYLRPGADRIARLGGLHKFIAWNKPILTDSGGYQVFSLAARRKVHEHGVTFRSHLDGSEHLLTPEIAVDVQAQLGSDVAMVLDECVEHPATHERARESLALTLRWAKRGREHFLELKKTAEDPEDKRSSSFQKEFLRSSSESSVVNQKGYGRFSNPGQAQFGIIQGGTFPDLRAASVEGTTAIGFEAYAIGGLSVGEPIPLMYDITEQTAALLPADRLRYLMGVGTPVDLVESVARGIDLFDCVLPTRNARNGQLFTSEGRLNIKNAEFADDDRPLDPACGCYTCQHFSRAYLRHLFNAKEMTSGTLNTLHNLHFYLDTMQRIREAIVFATLEELRQSYRRIFPSQPLNNNE